MKIVRFWLAAFYGLYIFLITAMLAIVFLAILSPSITVIWVFKEVHETYLANDRIVLFFLASIIFEWLENLAIAIPRFHKLPEMILDTRYRVIFFWLGSAGAIVYILFFLLKYL